MMRFWLALCSSLCLFVSNMTAEDVPSGCRVALLLGNGDYTDAKLDGMSKSLDRVEQACSSQGYRVVRRENLDEKVLKATVEEFALSVPTNGVAIVYFYGFGAHVERFGKYENLLRPLKASIKNENDYRSRGLNLNQLTETLHEESGSRTNLIFLDACWESPLRPETDKVRGGFRAFDVSANTTVLFAADSTQTLPMPTGDAPSPLANALASHLQKFDGSVQKACESIGSDVGKVWFAGATASGIGERGKLPLADSLHEGKTPGEGFVNSMGMVFRWCPPGSFRMGSEHTDSPSTRDRKAVDVTLSQGFWMGEYEVTQREYSRVMRKNVPNGFTVYKNAPFWGVTDPKGITQFCDKLNDLERKAGTLPKGWEYVVPTEAKWEYACRAGSTGAYCFGDDVAKLGSYGNVADHALLRENPNYSWAVQSTDDGVGEALASVGTYRPNAWGLRDMHGNVAELVADHLADVLPGGTDPLVQVKKEGQFVLRGGAWCSVPLYCESSFRNALTSRDKLNFVGYRIALKKVK